MVGRARDDQPRTSRGLVQVFQGSQRKSGERGTVATWKWVKLTLFPMVSEGMKENGFDISSWSLDDRSGKLSLFRTSPDGESKQKLRGFSTPGEALAFFDGVRLLALEQRSRNDQGRG